MKEAEEECQLAMLRRSLVVMDLMRGSNKVVYFRGKRLVGGETVTGALRDSMWGETTVVGGEAVISMSEALRDFMYWGKVMSVGGASAVMGEALEDPIYWVDVLVGGPIVAGSELWVPMNSAKVVADPALKDSRNRMMLLMAVMEEVGSEPTGEGIAKV